MLKKLSVLFAAFLILLSGACSHYFIMKTFADDALYRNEETGFGAWIRDGEDLLSEDGEKALLDQMIRITAFGNVTFESTTLTSTDSYGHTRDVYQNAGYFQESGILFLIDMGHRHLDLYSGGKIEKTITPSYANSITDNVYRYASKGDYDSCAREAFREAAVLLEGGRIAQPMKMICMGLIALILALLINYGVIRLQAYNSRVTPEKEEAAALLGSAVVGTAAGLRVTRRERHTSSSGGGSSGGGGGGGGGGFSGGGHSF